MELYICVLFIYVCLSTIAMLTFGDSETSTTSYCTPSIPYFNFWNCKGNTATFNEDAYDRVGYTPCYNQYMSFCFSGV